MQKTTHYNFELTPKHTIDEVNDFISEFPDTSEISDGFNTFGEVNNRFYASFLFILKNNPEKTVAFKTLLDHNQEEMEGWFFGILQTEVGQICCHLPMEYWNELKISERKYNSSYDYHDAKEMEERLLHLFRQPKPLMSN